jgi:hypothetical protein
VNVNSNQAILLAQASLGPSLIFLYFLKTGVAKRWGVFDARKNHGTKNNQNSAFLHCNIKTQQNETLLEDEIYIFVR